MLVLLIAWLYWLDPFLALCMAPAMVLPLGVALYGMQCERHAYAARCAAVTR